MSWFFRHNLGADQHSQSFTKDDNEGDKAANRAAKPAPKPAISADGEDNCDKVMRALGELEKAVARFGKASKEEPLYHGGTPLPASEQGKPRQNKYVCSLEEYEKALADYESGADPKAVSKLLAKSMDAVVAEHEALMAKINGKAGGGNDDGDDDDNGDVPPTGAVPVKDTKPRTPGSSNRVHTPHPESSLATRDGRTVHSVHQVNRRVRGAPVQKSGGTTRLVNIAGVDLSTIFTGVQLKPA